MVFYYICSVITGIYKIRNTINNKVYIGSATDIKKRWRDHKWYLKENKHHNPHLQASYNKYGKENFEFVIELECEFNNLLLEESNLIKLYKSKNKVHGYNINDPREIQFGVKCSDNTKQILSERMMGDKNPMYGKRGQEHPKHGYVLSDEKKRKLSEFAKNRKGGNSNASKLTDEIVLEIRYIYKTKLYNQTELSKIYNVTQITISDIVRKKRWTHI